MNATVYKPMGMTVAETVLKEAKQILDELGIVFFLRHGTCLGAVREGCLIAWDDDLDVGSVIGLHGLTEEQVYEAVDLFSQKGFTPDVIVSEIGICVEMKQYGVPIVLELLSHHWGKYLPVSGHLDSCQLTHGP
jgi:hypothetical protein